MRQEKGNFLLQTLLIISLLIMFVPFLIKKISRYDERVKLSIVSEQIRTFYDVSKIYINESINSLPIGITKFSKDNLNDLLEPYGLPLGFNTKTVLDQEISLVIHNTNENLFVYLLLTGGQLTKLEKALLVKKLGYQIKENKNALEIYVSLEEGEKSDFIKRNETKDDYFLTNLNMGNFNINNVNSLGTLNFIGTTVKSKFIFVLNDNNNISNLESNKVYITNRDFLIKKTDLEVDSLNTDTIGKYNSNININVNTSNMYNLKINNNIFMLPYNLNIDDNFFSKRVNFDINVLSIKSNLYTEEINAKEMITNYIKYKDNININLSGITILPDILITNINNDNFKIIDNEFSKDTRFVKCKDIINKLNVKYNNQSLSQYLICYYVLLNRLSKRIDIKKCLMAGLSDCK